MNMVIDHLLERFPVLDCCKSQIQNAYEVFADCYRNGGKVLFCGNGGSAADAEHWSGELLKGFTKKRPLSVDWNAKLPDELASSLQGALPAIPLTSFVSASTAFANDVNPDHVFAQLVWALGNSSDVLVCISTSGNSKNISYAADAAIAKGISLVFLTGKKGGELIQKDGVAICVPETETWKVQELHLPVYHAICLMLEQEFF